MALRYGRCVVCEAPAIPPAATGRQIHAMPPRPLPSNGLDWRRIAYNVLVSRSLDEVEEATNRNRASVPKDHVVLYQFSARGHDVAQCILGAMLTGRHDGAGAYYRSRPLLLSLGLTLEDALGSPLGRAGGFSDGRDIGVVCNLPNRDGPVVLPMSGDVGSQYTPTAGWAQAITYHRDVLKDREWDGSIGIALGGDASVATNGFWSALTMATTLKLPMLFYIEDNDLGISVKGGMQTPGGNIARNLASFRDLLIRDGDGTDPGETARLLREGVDHVRSGAGPALVHLTLPRLSSHSGPDNQKGYRSDAEIAADQARDPLPRLKEYLVPAFLSPKEWKALEAEVASDVEAALAAARARAVPDAGGIARFVFEEEAGDRRQVADQAAGGSRQAAPGRRQTADGSAAVEAFGGLSRAERAALGGTDKAKEDGELLRFAEAVRRTLRRELEVNPKVVVFGEDVGKKGGVHLVTEGLQKQFGAERVFDTSLSEEGIIGRASGLAIAGLMPVAEIQFRKYADPATEQLNNAGTLRWRTADRFASPMVVRMPGGFGKDVGDPWHSLSDEVRFAHAYGWQVAMPSNAADAVGLLRAAMRSANPTVFFEHRSLLMTGDGSARYPGDDYVLPFGRARVIRKGRQLTLVSWGAMVHRCTEAAGRFDDSVELIDLRTISPWDRATVLASVTKTGRCLIVHEDNLTAGFGAEVAATVAQEVFWHLDAPVVRLAPLDIPMPYHPVLLDAVLPGVATIASRIEALLRA
jgi:2-oxoisovalerate dehydrogenase E1 component